MREADSAEVHELATFVHLTWPAHPHQLASIRTQVHSWLSPLDLTEDARDDLVLAVNEAASNSVEHAYLSPSPADTVELTFWTEAHAVCIEIADHGAWRAPSIQPTGRGRGIEIMRRLMAVLIRHDARGTRVLLRHPLPGRSDSALHVARRGT